MKTKPDSSPSWPGLSCHWHTTMFKGETLDTVAAAFNRVGEAKAVLLRIQSKQLTQRANLHFALGDGFEQPTNGQTNTARAKPATAASSFSLVHPVSQPTP